MKKFLFKKGFSLVEVLVVLAIMGIVASIVLAGFNSFSKSKSVSIGAETITAILRQARNETLTSKDSLAYGVNFGTNKITIFVAPTYSEGVVTNRDFTLNNNNTNLTVSLSGGGTAVVFSKLNGETTQNGTITVSVPGVSNTKTVTIYKTGLVEIN